MEFTIRQQVFQLSAEKAMFWKNTKSLLIADMHLSKETHFRKHGIAVPDGITQHNFFRLSALVNQFQPERIIVLGDLFHSGANASVALFAEWKKQFQYLPFQLISGNHDIMDLSVYDVLQIEMIGQEYCINNFILTHHPSETTDDMYRISGHVHPAVRLIGKARQSLRLPCFWFGTHAAILPAFGGFTGMKTIAPLKDDTVFAVAEHEIIRVQ